MLMAELRLALALALALALRLALGPALKRQSMTTTWW